MQRLSTQLYDVPGGKLLLDMTGRVQNARFATNEHGFLDWSGFVPMDEVEAFGWYDFTTGHLVVSDGAAVVYSGRVEDPSANGDASQGPIGLELKAFGYQRALYDIPYTALWSTQHTDAWEQIQQTQVASRTPERFSFSTDGELRITPSKGEAFDSSHLGSLTVVIPHLSSRQIQRVTFSYDVKVPNATWTASLSRFTDAFSFQSTIWSTTSTGTGTQDITLTGCDRLVLNLQFARARTTLGTTIAAGSQTVTPGSMTGIVVGSVLNIGQNGGAVNSEQEDVAVTAVTATTFTATFKTPHNSADTVSFVFNGEEDTCYVKLSNVRIYTTTNNVVYVGDVAADVISAIDTVNPAQIDSYAALIQVSGLDLKEAWFEDEYAGDILDKLCAKGDSAGNRWEWKIWDGQRLRVQPERYGGLTWYVDEAPRLVRSLDGIINSAYATYQDVSGRTKRTAVNSSAASVASFGITRRAAINASTTDATSAALIRDTYISDNKYNGSLGEFDVSRLRTVDGAPVPGWMCRAGDTIVVRGYPAGSALSIDYVRSFPVLATEYAYSGSWRDLGRLRIVSTRKAANLALLLANKD